MKKNNFFTAAICLILLGALSSCKKDSAPKDYNSLLKNSVWTGEFNYTGKAVQPASIEFQEGGAFTWHELAGEYTGAWKLENSKLTVTFSSGSGFTTIIADDNTFSSIQNFPGNSYAMNNAALNAIADDPLDNTNWTAPNLVLHFKAGNKVDMEIGAVPAKKYADLNYVRKGKSIRFSPFAAYKWFMVINTASVMKGSNAYSPDPTTYVFQAAKQ